MNIEVGITKGKQYVIPKQYTVIIIIIIAIMSKPTPFFPTSLLPSF